MSLRNLSVALLVALATLAAPAFAQFAAFVLPARFELKAKPGQKISEVMEIGNDGAAPQEYRLRTADWTLRPDGAVDFIADTLSAGSCRPWVAIERHTLKLGAQSKRRFRFEVQVPADAKPVLCRFAILIEASDSQNSVTPGGSISMPIQGRIGIIVYVRVGDIVPELKLERLELLQVNGRPTPVAWIRNTGLAHGRPEGTIAGTDAKGKSMDFTVSPLPILPGELRPIPMWPPDEANGKPPELAFPIKLKGTVEWEGGKQPIDTTLGAR
jgi:fimbrial chaperone protein